MFCGSGVQCWQFMRICCLFSYDWPWTLEPENKLRDFNSSRSFLFESAIVIYCVMSYIYIIFTNKVFFPFQVTTARTPCRGIQSLEIYSMSSHGLWIALDRSHLRHLMGMGVWRFFKKLTSLKQILDNHGQSGWSWMCFKEEVHIQYDSGI